MIDKNEKKLFIIASTKYIITEHFICEIMDKAKIDHLTCV